jgi:hypothetical protein
MVSAQACRRHSEAEALRVNHLKMLFYGGTTSPHSRIDLLRRGLSSEVSGMRTTAFSVVLVLETLGEQDQRSAGEGEVDQNPGP